MFIPFLSQTSLQLAARLETFKKEYFSMFDGQQSKTIGDGGDNVMGMDVSALELHDPTVHSRAGLYIFLNSLVSLWFGKQVHPMCYANGSSSSGAQRSTTE
jgi:hypothetical protein